MRLHHSIPSAGATLLALSLVPFAVHAQAPRPAGPSGTAAPAAPASITEESAAPAASRSKARRPANPVYPQIVALLETEKGRLAELRARLAGTRDGDAAMAIQREIEQTREQTEIGVLRLQAEHARKSGRAGVAEGIEAAIRRMTQPPARAQAATRPATDAATSTPTR